MKNKLKYHRGIQMTARETELNRFWIDHDMYWPGWRVMFDNTTKTPYYTSEEQAVGAMRLMQEKHWKQVSELDYIKLFVLIPGFDSYSTAEQMTEYLDNTYKYSSFAYICTEKVVDDKGWNKVSGYVFQVSMPSDEFKSLIANYQKLWTTYSPMTGPWNIVTPNE